MKNTQELVKINPGVCRVSFNFKCNSLLQLQCGFYEAEGSIHYKNIPFPNKDVGTNCKYLKSSPENGMLCENDFCCLNALKQDSAQYIQDLEARCKYAKGNLVLQKIPPKLLEEK